MALRKGRALLGTLGGNPIYLDPDFICELLPHSATRNSHFFLLVASRRRRPPDAARLILASPPARARALTERNSREDLANGTFPPGHVRPRSKRRFILAPTSSTSRFLLPYVVRINVRAVLRRRSIGGVVIRGELAEVCGPSGVDIERVR